MVTVPHRLPRVVVAAPSTGQGKTTVATGLMAALSMAGHQVSGHKVGPDYIDPGYHALATGRPGRNLDPHLVGAHRVVPMLLHGAADPSPADVAVIEGVMGLHDGRLGTDGFASTAHVAALTASPVVLVLDIARLSRSAGAIAAGVAAYDDAVQVAGVVLNRAGSERNVAEVRRSLERTGLPVLGVLPRDERLSAPSRHLGLVPAVERDGSVRMVQHLGEQVARHLDLEALIEVARAAPVLDAQPWAPADEVRASGTGRPVVALAGGRAFTFRYPETEELLRAAGCEVVTFDPLTDRCLPSGTQGVYLGGGFPEVYAAELAANSALLGDLRAAAASGVPTVAECAGLLLLGRRLDSLPMAGVVPSTAVMTERLVLRYPTATAGTDSLLTRVGEQVTGHEFHRTSTTPPAGASAAWQIDGVPSGFADETLHASYLHVHWAGHPHLAQRFADAAHAATPHTDTTSDTAAPVPWPGPEQPAGPPVPTPGDPRLDPLRHHSDATTGESFLDLAVNVFDAPRPAWLDDALREAVAGVQAYPDAEPARAAVARLHARDVSDVLPTAGAAEAFTLVARLRPWRRPVVVHPQSTMPHTALEAAGHRVTAVLCRPEDGFALDPAAVPTDADLVVVGNPTAPPGVRHRAASLRALQRRGRLLLVDEAFMDAVPGETETLVREHLEGVVVVRSLAEHWSIPGIRAGYVVGDPDVVGAMAAQQTPWSVSGPAVAAAVACTGTVATAESRERAATIAEWREALQRGLAERGIEHVPSAAPFVLARLGLGGHAALRAQGVAVRRADSFSGLGAAWVRIAVRPRETTLRLLSTLDRAALVPASA